jgi:hypothetical protein
MENNRMETIDVIRKQKANEAMGVLPAAEMEVFAENSILWPGFIPDESVTLIAGQPAVRAQFLCDLAARVTAGADWVDGQRNGEYVNPETGMSMPQGTAEEWDDHGPLKVVAFVANRTTFHAQFCAYGGNPDYLDFGSVAPKDLRLLRNLAPKLVIADPLALIRPGLSSEERVRKFLTELRALQCAFILGTNSSTRQQIAGSAAWQEADGCWNVTMNGKELTFEHANGSLIMDVTPEGLRDARTPEEKLVKRTEAEWWLLGHLADGEKRLKDAVIAKATAAGFTRRQIEHAFGKLEVKWESTRTVPRNTVWWME